MRKATVIMMAIVLLGLGGMMLAANSLLGPLQRDAETSKSLTRYLESRGDLVPGSRAKVMHVRATRDRLATQGSGLLVEIEPSEAVRRREGGLRGLARTATKAAVQDLGLTRIQWVEIALHAGPAKDAPPLRTLVPVGSAGEIGEPIPSLPPVAVAPGTPSVPGPADPPR